MAQKKSFRKLLVPSKDTLVPSPSQKTTDPPVMVQTPGQDNPADTFVHAASIEEPIPPNNTRSQVQVTVAQTETKRPGKKQPEASVLTQTAVIDTTNKKASQEAEKALKRKAKLEKKRAKLLAGYTGTPSCLTLELPADLLARFQMALSASGDTADLVLVKAVVKYLKKADKKK